uniref:Uncharacterized protein n=1 Tax=Cucumis melo TaxID=3656 RepID=A0A9I9E6Z5_CUCME
MKKVGANSDIHWVLFDEENKAVGFRSKSREIWKFQRVVEIGFYFLSFVFVSVIFGATGYMIYKIFINYMTEILSLRLEITVCTLSYSLSFIDRPFQNVLSIFQVEIEFPVSLVLPVKSVNFEVHFMYVFDYPRIRCVLLHVEKSVVRRLHAIFRSKVGKWNCLREDLGASENDGKDGRCLRKVAKVCRA